MTRSQTHHRHTHHQKNLICPITSIIENPISKDVMKRKNIRNKQNRTHQTRCQAIMIRKTKGTIDTIDEKLRRAILKTILSNYARG